MFFISGILYCLWMVLDIVMIVLALGLYALVGGSIACFLTACIAGMLV